MPRNLGMKLSRGKYLFFIDNDDAITDTALEELFYIAEKFDADVVDCESFYNVSNEFWHTRSENVDALKVNRTYKKVNEPTLLSADIHERMIDFMNRRFTYPLWTKLIKRDFLIKNHLEMIESTSVCEDAMLTCCILCLAPKYALVPNVVNFYRVREDSLSNNKASVQKIFHKQLNGIVKGFAYLEDFFSNTERLSQHRDVKFMAIGFLLNEGFYYLSKFFLQIPSYQLYELILSELSGIKDKTAFTAYLFSQINVFYLQLAQAQQVIYQKDAQIKDLQNQLEKARDDTSKI